MTDIFAVQDDITGRIVGQLWDSRCGCNEPSAGSRKARAWNESRAYDLVLRATGPALGTGQWYQTNKELLERAIALDPQYSRARQEYAWLMVRGWAHRLDGEVEPPQPILENAIRSVELDPDDAFAHRTAAWATSLAINSTSSSTRRNSLSTSLPTAPRFSLS